MFGTTNIKVYILPVIAHRFAQQTFIVMGIHVTEVVSRRTGKARHRREFQGEYRSVINLFVFNNAIVYRVPRPLFGITKRRFARFCRQELVYFRKFEG